MKKLGFILYVMVLLLSNTSKAQLSLSVTSHDSIFIRNVQSVYSTNVNKIGDHFFIPFHGEGIRTYDAQGDELGIIRFEKWNKRKHVKYYVNEPYVSVQYDKLFADNEWGYFQVLDTSGFPLLKTNIWKNYKKQYINGILVELIGGGRYSNPSKIVWRDTIIFPIRPLVYYQKIIKKSDKYERMYHYFGNSNTHELDLLPEFPLFHLYKMNTADLPIGKTIDDKKGERMQFLKAVGIVDPYWQKELRKGYFYPMAQTQYYDFDSVRKQIICGNSVQAEIKVYDLAGKHIKTFGQRGRHLLPSDNPYRLSKQVFMDSLKVLVEQKSAKWTGEIYRFTANYSGSIIYTSYLNSEIKYDAVHNRTYRLYSRPVPFTQQEVYRMANSSGDSREQFDSLHYHRKTYLQIYDHNDGDRLIYDEAVPAPFHILEVKGDTLWAVAGVSDKGLRVLKYHLRKE